MEDIVMRLIDLVEKTSPALWQIAMQQVKAQIAAYTIWAVVFLGIVLSFVGVFMWCRKLNREFDDEVYEAGEIGAIIVSVGCSLGFFSNIVSIALRLMSPAYYAILVLTQLVK